jgi:murein L,D-transpeptidase YafK
MSIARRKLVRGAILGLLVVAIIALAAAGSRNGLAAWARLSVPHEPCPTAGMLVQVDTRARVLALCRAGREEAFFRIALGRGGIDKRVEGDFRTPLGRYALSPGRSSRRFHLFLPVGYPTVEQARQGLTGSAIGVHGPDIGYAWLGHATVWADWTLGCIALGTQDEVEQVALWVRRNSVRQIVIL